MYNICAHFSQGKECTYIVLSLVRSNFDFQVGFMADARRINVALSRARIGLVIIGNKVVFSKKHFWSKLITFFEINGLVNGFDTGQFQAAYLAYQERTYSHMFIRESNFYHFNPFVNLMSRKNFLEIQLITSNLDFDNIKYK